MSRHKTANSNPHDQLSQSSIPPQEHAQKYHKLLRITNVLELIPVSKSTWWAWCAAGKAPAPIRLGRTTCWRYSDILAFIENGGEI
jgi:predicted DNA-binding transcriptional regulator AlpA